MSIPLKAILENFHQKNKGGFVMKIKVLLTLLTITLLLIAIISGCGGGSDTTSPASLITPTPDYSDTGDTAYITVRVKWPEQGEAGSLSAVSEDGKEIITAKLPNNTLLKIKLIDIYFFDYSDDPNHVPWDKVIASGNIHKNQNTTTIPVKLIGKPTPGVPGQGTTGPPPALRVKIFAEAFAEYYPDTDTREQQLARSDPDNTKPVDLKVGEQTAKIKLLLKPEMTLSATEFKPARSIIANATGYSNDWDINANLLLMYGTPFPVATRAADPSGETSEPLEGQEIKFRLIEGVGMVYPDHALTDANGNCTVHFNAASGHNIIEASYQYDPDDPTTLISKTCEVNVILTPTPTPTQPPPTPMPTFTPEPTSTPTNTPTPPPYPSYILGTWEELDSTVTETGKTFTIEFTVPYKYEGESTMVNITDNKTGKISRGRVICFGEDTLNGQIRVDDSNIIMPDGNPYNSCFGRIYNTSGVLGDNHTIIWALHGTGVWKGYWRKSF